MPKRLQAEVWRTYRPGQERDKLPSSAYLAAAMAAVDAVAAAESQAAGQRCGAEPTEGDLGGYLEAHEALYGEEERSLEAFREEQDMLRRLDGVDDEDTEDQDG